MQKVGWPLFWCLEPEVQAALMIYQFDTYGFYLEAPQRPNGIHIDTKIESPGEIDKIMRVPSKYPKGFYSHG